MEIGHEIFRALGMTIVHSLWQGALLSVFVLLLVGLVKKSNARSRYIILCSGLFLLLAGFAITFVLVYRNIRLMETLQHAVVGLQVKQGLGKILPLASSSISERLFHILEPYYASIALCWLAGFLLMGFHIAGGAFLAHYKFRKGLMVPDTGIQNLFDSIKEYMSLKIAVKLRISNRMISPLVSGIFYPLVIIPSAAITGLSPDQIKAVMVHELAHIKRYDHIIVILQTIARQVLFFHPVAWFLIPEIDRERENCCDDFVIHNNNNLIYYIKALAMIQEMNLQSAPVNGLTGKSNQLLNRIKRLIRPEIKHSAIFRLSVILLFIAVMSVSAFAIIVSDHLNIKDKVLESAANQDQQQAIALEPIQHRMATATIQDKDGDKKKMKVVFVNDTIREMTVNGKPVSKEEMKEYATEIRKMQEALESSHGELDDMNEHLMELKMEREMALRDMELAKPELNFELNEEMLNSLDESKMKLEELKLLWENEEFGENMKKAREEAWKSHEDAWKNMEEARKLQKEYWDTHQDEFKLQWEQFEKKQDDYKKQWNKAKEAAEKAIEELKKNGTIDKDFEFHFNYDYDIPVIPPVPPVAPDPAIMVVPPVPHVEAIPAIPDIETDIDVPEVPENHESVVPEEQSDSSVHEGSTTKESLDDTLRELEE